MIFRLTTRCSLFNVSQMCNWHYDWQFFFEILSFFLEPKILHFILTFGSCIDISYYIHSFQCNCLQINNLLILLHGYIFYFFALLFKRIKRFILTNVWQQMQSKSVYSSTLDERHNTQKLLKSSVSLLWLCCFGNNICSNVCILFLTKLFVTHIFYHFYFLFFLKRT